MLSRLGLSCVVLAGLLTAPGAAGPALLFEPKTGKVLYAEDVDHVWHPASLTKIMTAYLTLEAFRTGRLQPDQKLTASEKATLQDPSKIGLPVNAQISAELALQAVVVKSANDATVILAEAIAGSEEDFVKLMNDTARRLGMKRTHFVNTNGLPAPDQVTTARDLAKLSVALLRDFPDQNHLWAQAEVRVGKKRLRTHNGLLRTFEGAYGIKTGFICDSGYNVVASATREGRRLVAVVLGETSGRERSVRAASLLEHGFQAYDWKQLFNATTLDTLPAMEEAKGIQSIRQSVHNWACNGRRTQRIVAKKRKSAPAATAQAGAAPVVPAAAQAAPPAKKPAAKAAAAPQAAPVAGAQTPTGSVAPSPGVAKRAAAPKATQ